MRWGTETPRAAPLPWVPARAERRWGVGGMRWREGLVSGWEPALAGGRFANRPYDRGGRTRAGVMRGLLVVGGPPSTGSGRTDLGGARAVGSGGCDGGTETPCAPHLPWVPARAGTTMGGVVGCVCARGWCQGGGPLSRAGGSRTAPTDSVGVRGSTTVACGGDAPAPRTCPRFPLSRERRVAGAVRRYQRGRDSPVRANVEPRPWETAHS